MRSSEIWTKEKIEETSKGLIGKKVSDVLTTIHKTKNKGSIGQAVETDVFNIPNNSSRNPDFVEAGIELKVIPLRATSKGDLVPKERMVLTMIDYMEDYKYEFHNSHLYNKTKMMQIIQYNHDYNNKYNSEFIDQYILDFPGEDREIIQADYNKIIERIKKGEAHLISESDTNYLSACRKGSGGDKDLRKQPYSSKKAPSRAFSLKTTYLRMMNNRRENTNKAIFNLADLKKFDYSFEEIIHFKVSHYKGKTKSELIQLLDLSKNENSKQILNLIVNKMFNYSKNISNASEFNKAGIRPKTVRIINGKLKESISFAQIQPTQLLERTWKESELYNIFKNEQFVFFVFEGPDDKNLKFKGVKFWRMDNYDIKKYGEVYSQMQKTIQIKGSVWFDKKYHNTFPKEKGSYIGHVRPKGRNSKDTYILPSGDTTPKQCFWLNKNYVLNILKDTYTDLK